MQTLFAEINNLTQVYKVYFRKNLLFRGKPGGIKPSAIALRLNNQHRITIRVEFVFLFYRFFISPLHKIMTGKSRDHHKER